MNVLAYLRVSTGMQERSGLGLEAQEAAIRAMAPIRGWTIVGVIQDAQTGKDTVATRPGLREALRMAQAKEIEAIAVAKLDRIARSTIDTLHILDRSAREGWGFIALDLNVDTTTNDGRLVATFMAAIAEWERGRIAERISGALAAKAARGEHVGRVLGSGDPVQQSAACAAAEYGGTLREQSERLAEWGIVSRTGRPLSPIQVSRLIEGARVRT